MKIIDPGHQYSLMSIDGQHVQILQFVKREGVNYLGNVGSYPGTTTQEVLRALIDRSEYVDNQIPDETNKEVLRCLRRALLILEERAAKRRGMAFEFFVFTGHSSLEYQCEVGIEKKTVCNNCGHLICEHRRLTKHVVDSDTISN